MSKLRLAMRCQLRWCHFNVTSRTTNQRGEGSLLSGTYWRHLSNAEENIFCWTKKDFSIFGRNLRKRSKSESNFLASPFGSEPVASRGGGVGVLFIIYEFGFLRQNLYRAAQSILETGQTVVCKCCQAGRPAKSIPNIVISNTFCAPQMLIASQTWLFSIYQRVHQTDIHAVVEHLQLVFWPRGDFLLLNWALARLRSVVLWRGSWIEWTDPCQELDHQPLHHQHQNYHHHHQQVHLWGGYWSQWSDPLRPYSTYSSPTSLPRRCLM